MDLRRDAEQARKFGLQFRICTKPGHGQKWMTVQGGMSDLTDAVEIAKSIQAYEVGVFIDAPQRGGAFYWTTRHPDLYNSTVIGRR